MLKLDILKIGPVFWILLRILQQLCSMVTSKIESPCNFLLVPSVMLLLIYNLLLVSPSFSDNCEFVK